MAPEVIQLNGPSLASDIWGFGATVIEMLTGSPPYAEIQNNMAGKQSYTALLQTVFLLSVASFNLTVMFRIVEDPHPPLPEAISHQCESFLKDCFQRDTGDRPSAQALFWHSWIQNHLVLEPVSVICFLVAFV